jgi:hypothetical protein
MGIRTLKRTVIKLAMLLCPLLVLTNCGGNGSDNVATAKMGGAIQGNALKLAGTVSTLAGRSYDSQDGTGSGARFGDPRGVTTDGTNLYVADTDNHTIRKVVIATGVVTTLAGNRNTPDLVDGIGPAARFNRPMGITTDGKNLYVADTGNGRIRKVEIATGAVSSLTDGGWTYGHGYTYSRFKWPTGITTDGTNLFVADNYNQTISKVVIATGVITTLAGSDGMVGSIRSRPTFHDGRARSAGRFQISDGCR